MSNVRGTFAPTRTLGGEGRRGRRRKLCRVGGLKSKSENQRRAETYGGMSSSESEELMLKFWRVSVRGKLEKVG